PDGVPERHGHATSSLSLKDKVTSAQGADRSLRLTVAYFAASGVGVLLIRYGPSGSVSSRSVGPLATIAVGSGHAGRPTGIQPRPTGATITTPWSSPIAVSSQPGLPPQRISAESASCTACRVASVSALAIPISAIPSSASGPN